MNMFFSSFQIAVTEWIYGECNMLFFSLNLHDLNSLLD